MMPRLQADAQMARILRVHCGILLGQEQGRDGAWRRREEEEQEDLSGLWPAEAP